MTNQPDTTPHLETSNKRLIVPLKAERIQLIFEVVDGSNSPYDFDRETSTERDARLAAGWRKRIGRPPIGRDLEAA